MASGIPCTISFAVGDPDGIWDGTSVGLMGTGVGTSEGLAVGTSEGFGVGTSEGFGVGASEGLGVGTAEGEVVGKCDGENVRNWGSTIGALVGELVVLRY